MRDSRKCPCGASGFRESILGPGNCEFCDGTEGGCGPLDNSEGMSTYEKLRVAAEALVVIYNRDSGPAYHIARSALLDMGLVEIVTAKEGRGADNRP